MDNREDLLFRIATVPAPMTCGGFARKSARFTGFSAGGTKTL